MFAITKMLLIFFITNSLKSQKTDDDHDDDCVSFNVFFSYSIIIYIHLAL